MTKLTKQGVRDLNAPGQSNPSRPSNRVLARCPHVWETQRGYDCWDDRVTHYRRCGLCQEVRR